MSHTVIIDLPNVAHRAAHALRASGKEPHPADIAALAAHIARKALAARERGDGALRILLATDRGRSGRDAIYPDYKDGRAPSTALPWWAEVEALVAAAFDTPILAADGHECDDVIATAATLSPHATLTIVSSDRDLWQLLGLATWVIAPGGAATTAEIFRRQFGFEAPFYPHYKAIAGDASDNIPGVPGLGTKAASALIGQWCSLDAVYRNLHHCTPRVARLLTDHEANARLFLRLATLDRAVPGVAEQLGLGLAVAR